MWAYLLISLKKKAELEIFEKLSDMKDVGEVHVLFGEWDLIAKVEAKSAEALSTFVIDKIRPLPEVEMTSTLIVAK